MGSTNQAMVLLVDDDPLVRTSLARLLEDQGLNVLPCNGGADALEQLGRVAADAVLSDIKMPGMNGLELLNHIRAQIPELPVLLMTGYADLEMAVTAIQNGVFDFILKPYNPVQLFHSLHKAIDFKRLRQLEANYQAELETRIRKAREELQATHNRLLQGEKLASIGQLAAGVAHEINNPAGFITSNLGTLNRYVERLLTYLELQETMLGAPCGEAALIDLAEQRRALRIDHIRSDIKSLLAESLDGADRIKTLVQSLKNFARVDTENFEFADINAGLESTINICWNEIKYVATLEKDYGVLPPAQVYPQQLNQVFMNLLVNAAHAIAAEGKITVRTWFQNPFIYVSIADTGSGIPETIQNRIYDPFFTTKEAGKGTGLGLSIAYDIVRKHQGEIEFATAPDAGTTFTVKLPLRQCGPGQLYGKGNEG